MADNKDYEKFAGDGALDGYNADDIEALEGTLGNIPDGETKNKILANIEQRKKNLITDNDIAALRGDSFEQLRDYNPDDAGSKAAVEAARKIVNLAAKHPEEIEPEGAVDLQNYMGLMEKSGIEFNDEQKALKATVDSLAAEFDKEYGTDKLTPEDAPKLELNENLLYKVAGDSIDEKYGKEDEETAILKNLAVQELKKPEILNQEILDEMTAATKLPQEKLEKIFTDGLANKKLEGEEAKIAEQLTERFIRTNSERLTSKMEELKQQMEADKALERSKLAAEFDLLDEFEAENPAEEKDKDAEWRKKRSEYVAANLEQRMAENADELDKTDEEWIEAQIIKALRAKHADDKDLGDDELLKKYGKGSKSNEKNDYNELQARYSGISATVSETVKSAYADKAGKIAARAAAKTNTQVNGNVKNFLNKFSEKHPKAYIATKIAASVGKSMVVSGAVKMAFGIYGMAGLSAVRTVKLVKKNWNEYKKQSDGKTSVKGFFKHLKDTKQLSAVIGGVAKTAAMATACLIPGANMVARGIALGQSVAKAAENRKAIKAIKEHFNAVMQKVKSNPKKSATIAAFVAGGAAIIGVGAYILADDDTKESIENGLKELDKTGHGVGKIIADEADKTNAAGGDGYDFNAEQAKLDETMAQNREALNEKFYYRDGDAADKAASHAGRAASHAAEHVSSEHHLNVEPQHGVTHVTPEPDHPVENTPGETAKDKNYTISVNRKFMGMTVKHNIDEISVTAKADGTVVFDGEELSDQHILTSGPKTTELRSVAVLADAKHMTVTDYNTGVKADVTVRGDADDLKATTKITYLNGHKEVEHYTFKDQVSDQQFKGVMRDGNGDGIDDKFERVIVNRKDGTMVEQYTLLDANGHSQGEYSVGYRAANGNIVKLGDSNGSPAGWSGDEIVKDMRHANRDDVESNFSKLHPAENAESAKPDIRSQYSANADVTSRMQHFKDMHLKTPSTDELAAQASKDVSGHGVLSQHASLEESASKALEAQDKPSVVQMATAAKGRE